MEAPGEKEDARGEHVLREDDGRNPDGKGAGSRNEELAHDEEEARG